MGKILEIAELMKRIVQAIVDAPEAVTIEVSAAGALRVLVAPCDVGKVIGSNGRTARVLRRLLSTMAAAAQLQLHLVIAEGEPI